MRHPRCVHSRWSSWQTPNVMIHIWQAISHQEMRSRKQYWRMGQWMWRCIIIRPIDITKRRMVCTPVMLTWWDLIRRIIVSQLSVGMMILMIFVRTLRNLGRGWLQIATVPITPKMKMGISGYPIMIHHFVNITHLKVFRQIPTRPSFNMMAMVGTIRFVHQKKWRRPMCLQQMDHSSYRQLLFIRYRRISHIQ